MGFTCLKTVEKGTDRLKDEEIGQKCSKTCEYEMDRLKDG